ncbi:hypothetical protein C8D87_102513 [Lentzea atacamensis]|uniref:S1 motif domain-containing protein n=1 Tax=Lentzea atacamensis TaxID=531938 RepID=A0ABX9ECU7_9PSEU|nr:hypothetical protein [Lentzea atacamensis]RAS68448.1 hypothetical protein C8D87_102513 [Lentzea atacamensis]
MKSQARNRYDVVHCLVIGHVQYGLLIESEDGERGFVDSSYVTDQPGEPWPEVGRRLRCLVLGYANDGRLRAATTPLCVEMVAAADDPVAAVKRWIVLAGRAPQSGGVLD